MVYADEEFPTVDDLRQAIQESRQGLRPPLTYHAVGDEAGCEPLAGLLVFFGPNHECTNWCVKCIVIDGAIHWIEGI